jgi:hypothetical protein
MDHKPLLKGNIMTEPNNVVIVQPSEPSEPVDKTPFYKKTRLISKVAFIAVGAVASALVMRRLTGDGSTTTGDDSSSDTIDVVLD